MIFNVIVTGFFFILTTLVELLPAVDSGWQIAIDNAVSSIPSWLAPFNEFFPVDDMLRLIIFVVSVKLSVFLYKQFFKIVRGA